jgi:uncharacterized membrane protein
MLVLVRPDAAAMLAVRQAVLRPPATAGCSSCAPPPYGARRHARSLSSRRCAPPLLFEGKIEAELEIRAPASLLFDTYSNIELLPQWSPMLERVELVDRAALRSEWSLRIPRPLRRVVRAIGMGSLVSWEAVHEVQPPRLLRWRSLSGVQNAGEATFDPVPGQPGCTRMTLRMTYTLPDAAGVIAGPLVESSIVQRFVKRTLLGTMEKFKDTLEAEAGVGAASGGRGEDAVPVETV